MSLMNMSIMVNDSHLVERVAAGAAISGVRGNARAWAMSHIWEVCALDGWLTAYSAGVTAEDYQGDPAAYAPTVGGDPDVISDAMILAGVQALIARETPETE